MLEKDFTHVTQEQRLGRIFVLECFFIHIAENKEAGSYEYVTFTLLASMNPANTLTKKKPF
jgi:hypothetical protein